MDKLLIKTAFHYLPEKLTSKILTPEFPRTLLLALHNKCNLSCVMCHREKDMKNVSKVFEVPLSTIKSFDWIKKHQNN